ncbi:MAG: hypothetical protein QMD50_01220 [Patescibacteria group bacterium]|nr:hypothetical protein [Patescibacteria group bacterium]
MKYFSFSILFVIVILFFLACIPVLSQVKVVKDIDVEHAVKYRLVQKPCGPRLEQVETITYIYYSRYLELTSVRHQEGMYVDIGDGRANVYIVTFRDIQNNKESRYVVPVPADELKIFQHPKAVFPKKARKEKI